MQVKTPTPLLELMQYLNPSDWITRVLLDPSITSSYNEPEFQDEVESLSDNANTAHLSVASRGKEVAQLLSEPDEPIVAEEERELPPLMPRIKAYLAYVAKKVFVETYEFEGLHLSDSTYTAGDGLEEYLGDELPLSMIIWTLLGVPNRPQWLSYISLGLEHNPWTLLKNMFGGDVHPAINHYRGPDKEEVSVGFRVLLLASLLIEVFIIKPVIFLIKFIEIFFKIPLNAFKFLTEYVPSFIKNVAGTLIGQTTKNIALTTELYKKGELSFYAAFGGYLVFGIATVILAPIHYAARFVTIAGAAFTSPLKSAKAAWALGSSFIIHEKLGNFNYIPAVLMGTIFLAASIALSSALWAIALPLVFTGLTSVFPALNGVINGLLASPLVASSWATINTAIASAWSYLGLTTVFAYASSALAASILGIHIAASTLAVGVAAGLVAAPTAIFGGRFAEAFSNGWARLNQMSFKAAFFPVFFAPEKDSDELGHGHHHGHADGVPLHPRQYTSKLGGEMFDSNEEVDDAAFHADQHGSGVTAQPHTQGWAYDRTNSQLTFNGELPTQDNIHRLVVKRFMQLGAETYLGYRINLPQLSEHYFDIYFNDEGECLRTKPTPITEWPRESQEYGTINGL